MELFWISPFLLLLGAIAVVPLLCKHWWERNFAFVALSPAVFVAVHYFQVGHAAGLLHAGLEYFSFICLIGSLFVVSGGIHITVKGEATPLVNSVFLLAGAVLANVLGTTGASMVLIRPWIRMNKYRLTAYHIVFFIFIVSNIGGALTPIGDPPLFLGYLRGIPFFWTIQHAWPVWLFSLAALTSVFYILDRRNFRRAPAGVRRRETAHEEWRFLGVRNLLFLALIVGAVFIRHPRFMREAVMLAAACLSYLTTSKHVHESNNFSFGPIREVAILFAGIFITMIPALEWLEANAGRIGITTAGQFYWGTGLLSSILDNAPTYLNFLSTARGLSGDPSVANLLAGHSDIVLAISVASVFFGAVTYIGNGPNFLVKSIANQAKVRMPGFFGFLFRYSLPFLLPVFLMVWFIFFR